MPSPDDRGFAGYLRADGRVGVRNHVVVLPASGACNRVVELVGEALADAVAIRHDGGSTERLDDLQLRTLCGVATNPNVGAVVVVGVGDALDRGDELAQLIATRGTPVELVTLAATGSVRRCAEVGLRRAADALTAVRAEERTPVTLASLLVGTECGGSDAYSGLTANPALGHAVDLLVAAGGSALLCELPELIGAEHLVAARAASAEVAAQVLDAVRAWEQMVVRFGEDLRGAQPSPGNQAGGLTTIEEKSLGAVAKGGSSPVVEVVGFGEAPSRRGLVLMDTPGHDVEQLTAMSAGGAQIVVFTTGRGTPTAAAVSPTIKVGTNPEVSRRLADHIDVDASAILSGTETTAQVAERILAAIVAVAGGRLTRAEGFRQRDLALPRTVASFA